MKARQLTSSLVDQNGYPIRYHFFDAVKKPHTEAGFPGALLGFADIEKLLGRFGRDTLIRNGRFLFANVPMIRGAFIEQVNYSFPLEPQYAGTGDPEWGEEATAWLYDWDQDCTIRGAPFDMHTCSRVRMLGRKIDGDILTVFTEDPESQYPKIQLVRAHRVGLRKAMTQDVEKLRDGPWAGQYISSGVVFDRMGRMLGVHVLGQEKADDAWVKVDSCRLDYRPDYSDQARGISELVASIRSLDDLKRLNEYELRAQQQMSSIGLIEKNETGYADETQDVILRAKPAEDADGDGVKEIPPLIVETYEAGGTRYYRSGTGSGLEAFRGDRPSSDASAFESRIVRRAMYGIEWDADFALALKDPGGAWARTILQKVNRAIANNQEVEAKTLWWIHTRALARAVYELKVLRPPKDGDIFSWNYRGPAKLTADSGNDANAKRSDYILGTRTLQDEANERGKWWREIRRQRETEVRDKLIRAKALLAEFPELDNIETALKLLENPNPNTATPLQQQSQEDRQQQGEQ